MIQDVKDEFILQDFNQEPSTSSKYEFKDWGGGGGGWNTSNHAREQTFGTQANNPI